MQHYQNLTNKRQAGLTGIGQQAAMSGNLGGGREGVMRAQYQNMSDQDANRALYTMQN